MVDETPKRFDRIIAILIQLQSRRIVKAQDLADRFQVSIRTIYRDIRTLEASGVPILAEAGSGYSIMEGYKLPPVMFTREEASSFVAAEKLMQQFTDKNLGSHFSSALYKVKSVLRGSEKDWVSTLETQIYVQAAQEKFKKDVQDALEIIMESIAAQRQCVLSYKAFDASEATERTVEPVGLFNENSFWYIVAYCHLRQDYRQFRTDRIAAIRRASAPYVKQHGNIADYRTPTADAWEGDTVRILVEKKIAKYMTVERKHYGFEREIQRGDKVEMIFKCPKEDGYFPRWYLMYADYAEIIEPESMKYRVRDLALKAVAKLGITEEVLTAR